MNDEDRRRSAERWASEERLRATTSVDCRVIDEVGAARDLVVLHLSTDDREGLAAAYRLGAVYAELGATPSLAANVVDAAHATFEGAPPTSFSWTELRSAFVEGFVARLVEDDRTRALRAFKLATCSVRVNRETVAVVPPPTEDGDTAHAHAAKLATEIIRAGYKRALVGGEGLPRDALLLALESVGVVVLHEVPSGLFSFLGRRTPRR